MTALYVLLVMVAVPIVAAAMSVRIIKQYERAVLFELGKVKDSARGPGMIFIVPFIHRVHRVSLRIITMPIQSQGIITKDNVSIGELAIASDVMMAHPLALQLRNLQTLVEVAVDKNSTVVFPAPLMSTIAELGAFLEREGQAAGTLSATPSPPPDTTNGKLVPS